MKIKIKVISIVLFISALLILVSCQQQKAEWKGTIEEVDGVTIDLKNIKPPVTKNHLVIEGAGGLLVPLNDSETILNIIKSNYKVIVVSRHYLGSINHTLLTVNLLKERGFDVSIVFNGKEHPTTETIIKKMTGVPVVGRIDEEPYFDNNVVNEYAEKFRDKLK